MRGPRSWGRARPSFPKDEGQFFDQREFVAPGKAGPAGRVEPLDDALTCSQLGAGNLFGGEMRTTQLPSESGCDMPGAMERDSGWAEAVATTAPVRMRPKPNVRNMSVSLEGAGDALALSKDPAFG